MKKCPHCGQPTVITSDWACPWCGYPLISSSYKRISKTYRELREEKRREAKSPVREKSEISPIVSPGALPPTPPPEPEPQPTPEAQPEPEPKPIPEFQPTPEPQPTPKATPKPKPTPKSKRKPMPEPQPTPKAEPEPTPETEPIPEPQPTPEAEVEPIKGELTVEELYSILEADKIAAEAKLSNRILKVTGVIYRKVINDNLTTSYVILNSTKNAERRVTCTFDKKYDLELSRLIADETVTVQGAYNSYGATILLTDCALV